jgi:uncharacterized Zn-finger protein
VRLRSLGHAWTGILLISAITFLVILPYQAIVQNGLMFWSVTVVGLLIAFICAASETAYGLACGADTESETYERNSEEQKRCEELYLSESPQISDTDRASAKSRSDKLARLLEIGRDYKSIYNPTLIVANNVAIITVAILAGLAATEKPIYENAHKTCEWLHSAHSKSLEVFRCIELFGHSIPFLVSSDAFQSAFSLTVILIIAEMLPKQVASIIPAAVAEKFFHFRYFLVVVSLCTGPTFGTVGLWLEGWFKRRTGQSRTETRLISGHYEPEVARMFRLIAAEKGTEPQEILAEALNLLFVHYGKATRAEVPSHFTRRKKEQQPESNIAKVGTGKIAVCYGENQLFDHPRIFLDISDGRAICPYCSQAFEQEDFPC